MGCCLCHPLAEVVQDPDVSFHTTVGDIVVLRGIMTSSVKGCCSGIMYVKEDTLYYETQCGSSLCCKCFRQGFLLSEIQNVEVVQNQAVRYQMSKYILLSPGLKITAGQNTTILVAVSDAAAFSQQLLHACNSKKGSGNTFKQ